MLQRDTVIVVGVFDIICIPYCTRIFLFFTMTSASILIFLKKARSIKKYTRITLRATSRTRTCKCFKRGPLSVIKRIELVAIGVIL